MPGAEYQSKINMTNINILPTTPPPDWKEDTGVKQTHKWMNEISRLHNIMMAGKEKSLLVILQGMDAAGKDSTVKHVLSCMNPVGLRVISFKKPTEEEMAHDFLWRVHQVTPSKGTAHVFIRSHYEDILIQRVHRWVDETIIHQRIQHINDFERLLTENGTTIVKCFLNISPMEQLKRLNARTLNPEKYWKHNQNDYEERKHWDTYMKAYEDALNQCSDIPWHKIPSDNKRYKEYEVARVVLEALQGMDLRFPPLKS
jgi:PPK2 family polyphosphate:nucleotide phosphotransferase